MSADVEMDWGELSDEEVAGMSSPPSADSSEDENEDKSSETGVDPADSEESSDEPDTEGNGGDDTGGADDTADPDGDGGDSGDERDGESDDSTSQDPFDGEASESAKDDQSEDDQTDQDSTDDDSETDDTNFKARYEEVMAPFKASGREISLDSPEQARRLMQMGVDYAQKMQHLKPFRRILQTLQQAKLLDPDRINFLIDLDKKNPEAIKKLLRDSSIDPMDLDTEDSTAYSPTDHSVSEEEMGVREAFEAIEDQPGFDKTVQVLTKEWDGKSRALLADNPNIIGLMHGHIANGTYEKVWGEVVKLRVLGDLVGLSDLEAYDKTGQAMAQSGKLADPQTDQANSSDASNAQASAQGNGSPNSGKKANAKAQKRAASPTRGGATNGGGKPKVPDLASMTDEEVLAFDLKKLSKL